MITKLRKKFPIFFKQKKLVYLDSAATACKPDSVIQAIREYYEKYSINSHSESSNTLFKKVNEVIQESRRITAEKVNTNDNREIIFFPSATYSLNILALSLKNFLKENDEIYLTKLEHSSNFYPWKAIAHQKKVKLKFLPLNKNLTIDVSLLNKCIGKKTKIVSFVHVSNGLGVINQVEKIAPRIKKINPECLIIIDACQSISHLPINVKKWKIDALVFSGHKIYGPTGIGVLWIKKRLGEKLPDLLWGGGKKYSPFFSNNNSFSPLVQKFEVGTLPLAQIFGLKAGLEFSNYLCFKEIRKHEKELRNYTLKKLAKLEKVIIYNQNLKVSNIILFNLKEFHAHDVADYLGKNGICVRAGNFCCPYLKELIGVEAAIRVSFLVYNNKKEIDKLINSLKKVIKKPKLLI